MAHTVKGKHVLIDFHTGDPEGDRAYYLNAIYDFLKELKKVGNKKTDIVFKKWKVKLVRGKAGLLEGLPHEDGSIPKLYIASDGRRPDRIFIERPKKK